MTICFDTHAWLWLHFAPERLSAAARAAIADPANTLLLSAVVPWEMAIKHRAGKLRFQRPFVESLRRMAAAVAVTPLPIEERHACQVADLPLHHRDPFDRILIAQAQVEGLTILTADPEFRRYEVDLLPAEA